MLKVFGCSTYYYESEGKLEPSAKNGVFIGYEDRVRGLNIWSPLERNVILSKDVIFDKLSMLHSKSKEYSGKAKHVT